MEWNVVFYLFLGASVGIHYLVIQEVHRKKYSILSLIFLPVFPSFFGTLLNFKEFDTFLVGMMRNDEPIFPALTVVVLLAILATFLIQYVISLCILGIESLILLLLNRKKIQTITYE